MPTGKLSTYDLTIGTIVDIEPTIQLLSPYDTPLTNGVGAGGMSAITTGSVFEKKFEWLEEELLLPKSTTTGTATTGDAYITVASGDQLKFSTGDVLITNNANAERLRVTGYGTTTDTLLVTRAFQSTTAATISSGADVRVLGQSLAEGSDPENARAIDRVNKSAYVQIFGPTAVQVTGTENVVRKYGLSGTTEFDKQVANRTKEMAIQIEQALLYGKGLEDTTNEWRTMTGLISYITTNVDSSTTTITQAKLLDQMQACYDYGSGSDWRLVVGAKTKRVISGWDLITDTSDKLTVNINRGDTGRGQVVQYFDSDFGRVSVMLDRWCRTADAFGFNRDQAELVTLRPFQFEMLAKTGDSIKGQILCEKGLRFRREKHAFRFSALT